METTTAVDALIARQEAKHLELCQKFKDKVVTEEEVAELAKEFISEFQKMELDSGNPGMDASMMMGLSQKVSNIFMRDLQQAIRYEAFQTLPALAKLSFKEYNEYSARLEACIVSQMLECGQVIQTKLLPMMLPHLMEAMGTMFGGGDGFLPEPDWRGDSGDED